MKNFSDTCVSFIKTFFGTTVNERKIFKYLCFMGRKYPQLYVAKETIAKAIGCCEKTVQRSLARFADWGWIGRFRRAWQTWLIIIPDDILSLDLDDSKTFEKAFFSSDVLPVVPAVVPANVPLLDTHECSNKKSIGTQPSTPIEKNSSHEGVVIPLCLQKIIPIKQAEQLVRKFAQCDLEQAVNDGIWYNKQGNRVRDMFNFIYAQATKNFRKRKEKTCN